MRCDLIRLDDCLSDARIERSNIYYFCLFRSDSPPDWIYPANKHVIRESETIKHIDSKPGGKDFLERKYTCPSQERSNRAQTCTLVDDHLRTPFCTCVVESGGRRSFSWFSRLFGGCSWGGWPLSRWGNLPKNATRKMKNSGRVPTLSKGKINRETSPKSRFSRECSWEI